MGLGQFDLTAQARRLRDVEGKIQNVLFEFLRLAALCSPFVGNVNMAGRARAQTAAVTLDAGHHMMDGRFHQGRAWTYVDDVLGTIVLDEYDFGHVR